MTRKRSISCCMAASASLAFLFLSASPATGVEASRQYHIPSQPLAKTLQSIALESGSNLIAPTTLVDRLVAPELLGHFTTDQALAIVLRGSGLAVRRTPAGFVVEALASDPNDASNVTANDAIIVTGTRIRGATPVGSELIRIDRQEIERSGYATTQDIAQTIPQNFGGAPNEATAAISLDPNSGKNTVAGSSLNLRGLGNASTLVLLNGDRPPLAGFAGVFSDLSMIPASAIERIEVIADGASAIYGSDAVAGVVNIIPRLEFNGAETSIRVGTADGDSQDIVASQIVGKGWSSGHAVVAVEYYYRSALAAADRAYATDDLRPFGGEDLRGPYGSPETILAGGRSFAIPAGQNGTALTAASLLPDAVNLSDDWNMVDLLPTQTRKSVFAAVRQDLSPTIRLYVQGLYSARNSRQRTQTISNAPRDVPVTNPFYVDPLGTGQPVSVEYDFGRDLGREVSTGKVRAYGATAGLQSKLGSWTLDLRGNWGHEHERSAILNRVNTARLALALADPDPATAYNLFGDGPSTNPATIDAIRGSTVSTSRGTTWAASVRADGPLFDLPAGTVRLAAGSEYREERYAGGGTINDTSGLVPRVIPDIALPGPRRIRAFYAEALLPLVGGDFTLPGIRRLDVSLALRTEHYNEFGSTTNPKLGVNWEPIKGVLVHGSFGKSFRAPSFDNLRQDPGTSLLFAFTIPDPASPTGQSNILVQRGNDPNLKPEKATTWSAGIGLTPAALPGLRADLTYYHIDYRDRITSPAANLFNFLVNRSTYQGIITDNPSAAVIQSFYASPIFINPLGIAPNTITVLVNAQLQNLSVVRQSGLDADLRYGFKWGSGDAELGASASYIFKINQALTPSAPVTNVVDTLGNPVDFRMRARALWTGKRWGLSLFVNYLDGYTNLTNVTPQHVKSWTTVDGQLAYRFDARRGPLRGVKLALSATNLFDKSPPYAAYNLGTSVIGYDPDNASPLGRVVSLQLTKAW